jgi:hypothetical protein
LEQEAAGIPAHKIDENLWKNREQMEEILFLINTSHRPVAVSLVLYLSICIYLIMSSAFYLLEVNICHLHASSFNRSPPQKMLR